MNQTNNQNNSINSNINTMQKPESLPEDNLSTEQLGYQKRATTALLCILKQNSRAFLADEAGLGKTYTATGVMDYLFENRKNTNIPFIVIYVAPNKSLLSKNCEDIVEKSKKNIIDLGNINYIEIERFSRLLRLHELYNDCVERQNIDKRTISGDFPAVSDLLKQIECEIANLSNYTNKDLIKTVLPKTGKYGWFEKAKRFYKIYSGGMNGAIDRVTYIKKFFDEFGTEIFKKNIILAPISSHLINSKCPKYEESLLKKGDLKNREELMVRFLRNFKPQLIIWDEFHRYIKIAKGNIFNDYEIFSFAKSDPLHALFLSATPYQADKGNFSDSDIRQFDDLNKESDEKQEELPTFSDFKNLICKRTTRISQNDIDNYYHDYCQNRDVSSNYENELKKIMVRHERTQLQKQYESRRNPFEINDNIFQNEEYKDLEVILKNTANRVQQMLKAGFSEKISLSAINMPYFLAFSYFQKNRSSKGDGGKIIDNYYVMLKPDDKHFTNPDSLFLPDSLETLPASLKALPKQALAIYQLYKSNIENDMSMLIWVPPVNQLYSPGENSIFKKHQNYSKTLIFGERIYYQRAYSYLLSRYVDTVANAPENASREIKLPCLCYSENVENIKRLENIIEIYSTMTPVLRTKSLSDIIKSCKQDHQDISYEDILASIASPAVCAKRLGFKPEQIKRIEEIFNEYFHRDGIKQALSRWIECKWTNCQEYEDLRDPNDPEKDCRMAILCYCAEGNLLSVLEEWKFVLNEEDLDAFLEKMEMVLADDRNNNNHITYNRHTKVYPVSCELYNKGDNADDELVGECTFAERLTGDSGDVGSGENEDIKYNLTSRFSSPFWPMIMIAGRGAQEGLDFHQYCLRVMHLSLPVSPISLEQREGRVDRFRSLVVRRRAAKLLENINGEKTNKNLMTKQFAWLAKNKPEDNDLCPNFHLPEDDKNYFERLLPFWNYTNEAKEWHILENKTKSYRLSLGTYEDNRKQIDLSASECDGCDPARCNKCERGRATP